MQQSANSPVRPSGCVAAVAKEFRIFPTESEQALGEEKLDPSVRQLPNKSSGVAFA